MGFKGRIRVKTSGKKESSTDFNIAEELLQLFMLHLVYMTMILEHKTQKTQRNA